MNFAKAVIVGLFLNIMLFPIDSVASPPDTFVYVSYGTVRTLDPAVVYDTVSGQRVLNLYEPLIFFKGSSTNEFIPLLAVEVPTLENGGISAAGKTYTFKIRKGVKFHEGGDLTPEDVVYSFKRSMIADPDGGPQWMILEALTGNGSTRDSDGKIITPDARLLSTSAGKRRRF